MLTIVKQRLNSLPDKRVGLELVRVLQRVFPNDQDTALTAFATGGQTNALQLKEAFFAHEVTTVATAGDSVKLPAALSGSMHFVKNSGANAMQVFGQGTDTIDSVATATGISQSPGEGNLFCCLVNGNYIRLSGDTAAEVVTSLTSSAATFPINGLSAAQGGSVTVTGGASSTSGNAGGAVAIVGGTPGLTGAGGALNLTSGPGGGTSGAAGAINIAVGAATSGNGAAITITGGNGAAGTSSGGNVNLIPGTAVSTGIPGEVQINTVSGMMEAVWQQYLPASVPVSGSSYTFFMANRAYRVKAASVSCSSAGTVPTVDVIKDTGTTAPGGGTSVLTGVMTVSGTANTRVVGTVSGTIATITLAAGDRLATKWGGTVGSITGAIVTVLLVPA